MTTRGGAAASGDEPTTFHLHRAREGGEAGSQSLEWIVKRFTPLLVQQARYRIGDRLKETLDPEDVAMDVWRRTIPRLRDLEPRDGRVTPVLMRFLATTLRHRVRDLIDKHVSGKPVRMTRASADASDPLLGIADSKDIVRGMMEAEEVRLVQAAVQRLGEGDREVVVLRGIEQRSYAEVAEALGCTAEAAKQRYHRAIRRLKKEVPDSVFAEFGEQ